MSRGHTKNKLLAVWLPEELFTEFEKFLDKYSFGDTFSIRVRAYIEWSVKQKEGLNNMKLDLRKEQIEEKKQIELCLRGVIMPFHKQEQKKAFCFGCRQHHSTDFWKCFEKRKAKELEEANKT